MSRVSPEAVLQLGFSTALSNDRQQFGPVNLALVIDKSRSMADSDKMSSVKAAVFGSIFGTVMWRIMEKLHRDAGGEN